MFGYNNDGFVKQLVNVFNLNSHHANNISTNFTWENGKIVGLFEHDVDVEKYIQELKQDIVIRLCGSEEEARRFFDLESFPFSVDISKCTRNENETVKRFVIDIDDKIVSNLKIHFAMAFERYLQYRLIKKMVERSNGRVTDDAAMKMIANFSRLEKAIDPSAHLYSIAIDNSGFRNFYISMFKEILEEYVSDSSVFLEHEGNMLFLKNTTDTDFFRIMVRDFAEEAAFGFRNSGKADIKAKNCEDVLTDLIFEWAKESIDGYDCDVFTDQREKRDGHHFALVPKIALSATEVRNITKEEADEINEAFRKRVVGDVLTDISGQTENTQFTSYQEPLYGISNKQLALLIPEIMKSTIGYNETSKRFEYAVNLGNLFKSREHTDLQEDLNLILTRKCIPKGGKVHNYIWNSLSESGFGLSGYDEEELAQFVDKAIIEQQKIAEKQLNANRAISQAANSRPLHSGVKPSIGGSKGSLSSDGSTSRSTSPMPRNYSDDSLLSKGGFSAFPSGASSVSDLTQAPSTPLAHHNPTMPPLDEASGEYTKSPIPLIKVTEHKDQQSQSYEEKGAADSSSGNNQPSQSTDTIKDQQSKPNEQEAAGSSSEDYKPSSNMVSTESKPHKPKNSIWSRCTIS